MYSYPHKTSYCNIERLDLKEYSEKLEKSSTTLYFHIPFCESKCGYCNLFSVPCKNNKMVDDYIAAVKRHSDNWRELLDFSKVRFGSVVFGGGTPTLLSVDQLEELFCIAESDFKIDFKNVHMSVETSPNQTSCDKLAFLKSKGVQRISIGVQSFVQQELEQLERVHNIKTTAKAVDNIKEAGFQTLNIDLIYGINGQTMESLKYSIEMATMYEPEEIYIYPLYMKANTGIYKKFEIDREIQYRMYFMMCNILKEKGYFQISMRKFTRQYPEKEISCGFENMISLGCGGRSYVGDLHFGEMYTSRLSKVVNCLGEYIKKRDFFQNISFYKLDKDEIKRRFVIKNLLHISGINLNEYKSIFSAHLEEDFPILQKFSFEGWTINDGEKIVMTPKGLSLSDYLGPMLISENVTKKMEMFYDG